MIQNFRHLLEVKNMDAKLLQLVNRTSINSELRYSAARIC